jgi:serine/threonine-protein kinase
LTPPTDSSDNDLVARVERAVAPAYDLQDELGRGGAGIVYRAIDRRLKRNVALKILPPDLAFRSDLRDRFLREAETAAQLNHPNIVPIFSVDEREGLAWFVMALVDGGSIADRVRDRGELSYDEVRRILREVADALGYAHERGVVHRDIKPDNILIDSQTGRALVTDFGIARAITEGESRLTATGTAIGTPSYMSPEQCSGDRELDGRSDLYSLGAVGYFMIATRPPFEGPSTPVIMMKQVTERPAPLGRVRRDVPRDLDAILMKLLEKDPANRFQSGAQLIKALEGQAFEPQPQSSGGEADSSTFHMPTLDLPKPFMNPRTFIDPIKSLMVPPLFEPVPGFSKRMEGRQKRWEARALRHQEKERRKIEKENARPLSDRIRSFRRHLVSYLGTTTFLFGINAVTGGPDPYWWAVFPAMGMLLGLVNEGGSLWAAGARLGDVFSNAKQATDAAQTASLPTATGNQLDGEAQTIAEVLAGPRGAVASQAVSDRRAIRDLVSRLSQSERDLLPDVTGTAENLYQRIKELGRALHRLDSEIGPGKLADLDERIGQSERLEGTAEDDRRVRLLKRQRETLTGLLESRDKLSEQYESAGLLLQNLKLDLIRMRSSGLQSGLANVNSATQEARALSREIGYVLAAADELRDIDGRA